MDTFNVIKKNITKKTFEGKGDTPMSNIMCYLWACYKSNTTNDDIESNVITMINKQNSMINLLSTYLISNGDAINNWDPEAEPCCLFNDDTNGFFVTILGEFSQIRASHLVHFVQVNDFAAPRGASHLVHFVQVNDFAAPRGASHLVHFVLFSIRVT